METLAQLPHPFIVGYLFALRDDDSVLLDPRARVEEREAVRELVVLLVLLVQVVLGLDQKLQHFRYKQRRIAGNYYVYCLTYRNR